MSAIKDNPTGEPLFILASQSPRRRKLLRALGVNFRVEVSDVDESAVQAATPRALAIKTAAAKAEEVALRVRGDSSAEGRIILAADTIVVLDGEVLGKPRDRGHARAMLAKLSGRRHEVITGVAIQAPEIGAIWLEADSALVEFNALDPKVIASYVDSGQADDKAGAYGVQEVGLSFIASVEGDLSNVIGLPLGCLRRGLGEMGLDGFVGRSLRGAVLQAFPEVAGLSEGCLAGIAGPN